jgi:hypothetical protein
MAGKKMAELKVTMEFTAEYRALQREFDAVIEDINYNRPVDASTEMEAFKLRLTEVSTPIA